MSASTHKQKIIVAFTSFALASLGFVVAATVLIPSSAYMLNWLQTPEGLQMVGIMALLFGTPIVGAVLGICIGDRVIQPDVPPTKPPSQPATTGFNDL